jgi:hypothetical protein
MKDTCNIMAKQQRQVTVPRVLSPDSRANECEKTFSKFSLSIANVFSREFKTVIKPVSMASFTHPRAKVSVP